MKRNLNLIWGVCIFACVGGLGIAFGMRPPQQQVELDTKRFMERKLDYSREIMAGLATENYPQIARAAQDLMLLSHESDWNVITTPQYLKGSDAFREVVSRLRTAGTEENLDAATIAYFEVTLSCVRCHRDLRQGVAERALDAPTAPREP